MFQTVVLTLGSWELVNDNEVSWPILESLQALRDSFSNLRDSFT